MFGTSNEPNGELFSAFAEEFLLLFRCPPKLVPQFCFHEPRHDSVDTDFFVSQLAGEPLGQGEHATIESPADGSAFPGFEGRCSRGEGERASRPDNVVFCKG